jgi:hypothetical protein
VSIDVLARKKCVSCGEPAIMSGYDLKRHERTVFCLRCGT